MTTLKITSSSLLVDVSILCNWLTELRSLSLSFFFFSSNHELAFGAVGLDVQVMLPEGRTELESWLSLLHKALRRDEVTQRENSVLGRREKPSSKPSELSDLKAG